MVANEEHRQQQISNMKKNFILRNINRINQINQEKVQQRKSSLSKYQSNTQVPLTSRKTIVNRPPLASARSTAVLNPERPVANEAAPLTARAKATLMRPTKSSMLRQQMTRT